MPSHIPFFPGKASGNSKRRTTHLPNNGKKDYTWRKLTSYYWNLLKVVSIKYWVDPIQFEGKKDMPVYQFVLENKCQTYVDNNIIITWHIVHLISIGRYVLRLRYIRLLIEVKWAAHCGHCENNHFFHCEKWSLNFNSYDASMHLWHK